MRLVRMEWESSQSPFVFSERTQDRKRGQSLSSSVVTLPRSISPSPFELVPLKSTLTFSKDWDVVRGDVPVKDPYTEIVELHVISYGL